MARRRIEMHQYREVLARLRAGDTDREVARSGMMGREKVAAFRVTVAAQGWLQLDRALPDEASIAQVHGQQRRSRSTVSSVECWRELIGTWLDQGVQGTTIHAALCRNHGYAGRDDGDPALCRRRCAQPIRGGGYNALVGFHRRQRPARRRAGAQ